MCATKEGALLAILLAADERRCFFGDAFRGTCIYVHSARICGYVLVVNKASKMP